MTQRLSSRKQPFRDPHDVNRNSWERGIARDDRGMPFLDEGGQPVSVKEFAQRRNSGCWDHEGRQISTPAPVGTTTGGSK